MKLYVGNLSKEVSDAQLSELAKPYGTIVSANVATDRSSGASNAFVLGAAERHPRASAEGQSAGAHPEGGDHRRVLRRGSAQSNAS